MKQNMKQSIGLWKWAVLFAVCVALIVTCRVSFSGNEGRSGEVSCLGGTYRCTYWEREKRFLLESVDSGETIVDIKLDDQIYAVDGYDPAIRLLTETGVGYDVGETVCLVAYMMGEDGSVRVQSSIGLEPDAQAVRIFRETMEDIEVREAKLLQYENETREAILSLVFAMKGQQQAVFDEALRVCGFEVDPMCDALGLYLKTGQCYSYLIKNGAIVSGEGEMAVGWNPMKQ